MSAWRERWPEHLAGMAAAALSALLLSAWLAWLSGLVPGLAVPPALPLMLTAVLAFSSSRFLLAFDLGLERKRVLLLMVALGWILMLLRLSLYAGPPISEAWLPKLVQDLREAILGGSLNAALVWTLALLRSWWRGSTLANQALLPRTARRNASIAVLSFVALATLESLGRPLGLGRWLYPAATLGLASLALARLGDSARGRSGTVGRFGKAWAGTVLLSVAAALGAVAGLAALLNAEAAGRLRAALEPVPTIFMRVVTAIVLLIWMLFERAALALSDLFTRLGIGERQAELLQNLTRLTPSEPAETAAEQARQLPTWFVDSVEWLLLGLLALAAASYLARTLRRGGQRAIGAEGEVSSELSLSVLGQDLRDALRALAGLPSAGLSRLRGRRQPGVRGIYQQLLQLMADRERGRASSQTPFEFQPVSESELPEARLEIDRLTDAYVDARYGGQLPDEASLKRLKQAWRAIRRSAEKA